MPFNQDSGVSPTSLGTTASSPASVIDETVPSAPPASMSTTPT